MPDKPFIAARIPKSLNAALDKHIKATGENKTQVIINALSAYIGYSEDKGSSVENAGDRLTRLERKVADIEARLKKAGQVTASGDTEKNTTFDAVITTDNSSEHKESEEPKSPENVLNLDNSTDNSLDNTLSAELSNTPNSVQTTIIEESIAHPDPRYGEYVGQLTTKEVQSLPGLEGWDVKVLRNKLNNTKKLRTKIAKIPPYILFLVFVEGKSGRKEFIWYTYKTENTLSV